MTVALKDRRLGSLSVELTAKVAAADASGTIRGTAVVYDTDVDRGYGLFMRVAPGAFAEQVKDPARVKVLWQHDHHEPIGLLSELRDTKQKLDYVGRIHESDKLPTSMKALELLRSGLVDEVSVGFDILRFARDEDLEADRVTYTVTKGRLRELSVVTFGAMGQEAVVESVADTAGRETVKLESRRIRAELARYTA